jgi:hypothetical protein
MSLVDGYTLPFKLWLKGDTSGCDLTDGVIDGSKLDVNACPRVENLVNNGVSTVTDYLGVEHSLDNIDLRVINTDTNQIIGCIAPCKFLTSPPPYGIAGANISESTNPALYMCCPSPPVTSETCSAGPVVETEYVKYVSQTAPTSYAYTFGDKTGLHTCPGNVVYELEFCPAGSASYPAML